MGTEMPAVASEARIASATRAWSGRLSPSLISRPAFALLDAQPGLFYGALFLITYQTATLFNDTRETASFVRHTLAQLI